jgi:hypothetical protein
MVHRQNRLLAEHVIIFFFFLPGLHYFLQKKTRCFSHHPGERRAVTVSKPPESPGALLGRSNGGNEVNTHPESNVYDILAVFDQTPEFFIHFL